MLQHEYLARIRTLIEDLQERSTGAIDEAAGAITDTLVAGGDFYISPLGHGNEGDLLHRAGGMVAAQRFSFDFSLQDRIRGIHRPRPRQEPVDEGLEIARAAVKVSHMRAGDCIIVGSVSGRSVRPISLAIAAGEIGATVIGITAMDYTRDIEPIHSSGKLLKDVCDIVIDNCVPFGDASLQVEGIEENIVPISGVATTMTCWMICAQVAEKLLDRGLTPSFYMSANRPGGPEHNTEQQEQFNQQGY